MENNNSGESASIKIINEFTCSAYNQAAQKYHDLFHNEMNEKEYDCRLLDSFSIKFNRDSIIYDAGCGPSGHIGKHLSEKGIRVIGVDISEKCV